MLPIIITVSKNGLEHLLYELKHIDTSDCPELEQVFTQLQKRYNNSEIVCPIQKLANKD